MFNVFGTRQDPNWTEISASLRKGMLYVKMPREKVVALLQELLEQGKDLLHKEVLESEKSFVFYGSIDDWNEDRQLLQTLRLSGVVIELVLAIDGGLRNEARIDWISRIGGPPREGTPNEENSLNTEEFILS